MTFEIPEIPEAPEIKDPKFLSLNLEQITSMSDDELLKTLSGEAACEYDAISSPLQTIINAELQRRLLIKTSKPHWSVTPSFGLLIIAVLISILALFVSIIALPQERVTFLLSFLNNLK
ncbi:MAG: hypothetical protein BVN35_11565 [Proteobacteria bacterium ST_bin11]|nr:MAG: hypothetical protein BVN35_11565 [Proteobacteria bacterium ST_bin11]